MDPREQVQAAQDQIDELNLEKSSIQEAWEGERDRLGDPGLPKPPKLRSLNQELFYAYNHRDGLLKTHTELQAEFGTPGRKRNKQKSFAVTRASMSAADRHRRRQKIHPEFKVWCASQRPQLKFSLENWEDPAIQNRFILEQVAHSDFRVWCEEESVPFAATNWKNEGIRNRFEEWQAERELQRHLAEERRKEEEEAQEEEKRRQAEALHAAFLKERIDKLPPSFIVFAVKEWGVKDGDHSALLLLWDSRDEDTHALYQLWFKECVQAQKAS